MDIAIKNNKVIAIDLLAKIRNFTEICKIVKIEEILSSCLEDMPNSSPIDYIGELNKNDIMH